jgi:hypothetical protein
MGSVSIGFLSLCSCSTVFVVEYWHSLKNAAAFFSASTIHDSRASMTEGVGSPA